MERKYRLRDPVDFQRTRHEGRCWSHRLIVLCAVRNNLTYSRFGFAVSKRVGKATTRNRVRRRMREVVRRDRAGIAAGWDMVFIARQPIVAADYTEVVATVRGLLRRAGVWPDTAGQVSQRPLGSGK